MKKEEKEENLLKQNSKVEQNPLFVRLREDIKLIKDTEFIDEIENCLNMIFNKKYEPRSIKVNMEIKSALVTLNKKKMLMNL